MVHANILTLPGLGSPGCRMCRNLTSEFQFAFVFLVVRGHGHTGGVWCCSRIDGRSEVVDSAPNLDSSRLTKNSARWY